MDAAERAAVLGDGEHVRTIVTFDIDGTLVVNGPGTNRVHKDSFGAAIREVFNIEAGIDEVRLYVCSDSARCCASN